MRDENLFGRYIIGDLLGRGGFAEVRHAHFVGVEADRVAIKLISPPDDPDTSDDEFVRDLISRVRMLQGLSHPGIVRYLGVETQEGDARIGVVMSLLQGEDLKRYQARRPFSVDEVTWLAERVLEALTYLHDQGIAHRDLKPNNIYCCADGSVKLLDFGIAKMIKDVRLGEVTQPVGSVRYMAPERFHHETYLESKERYKSSDIYALGLILWEMLVGAPACRADTFAASYRWHQEIGVEDVRNERPDCPGWLAELIDQFATREFKRRPADGATALSMFRVARQYAATASTQATAPPAPSPPRAFRLQHAFSAVVLLLVSGGLGVATLSGTTEAPPEPTAARPGPTGGCPESEEPPLLRLCGSATVGASLAPALAEGFLTQRGATSLRRCGDAGGSLRVEGDGPAGSESIVIEVGGSQTGPQGLMDGRCAIGMASFAYDAMEQTDAALTAFIRGDLVEVVIGLEGIALVASADLDLQQITLAEAGAAFTEARWARGDRALTLCVRDDNSGTAAAVRDALHPSAPLHPDALRFEDWGGLIECLQRHPSAFGYVSSAALEAAETKGLQPLDLYETGAQVTHRLDAASVKLESYPISRRLRLYKRAAASGVERAFMDYARQEGQDLVAAAARYVDLTPEIIEAAPADADARALPLEAERASVNFYFEADEVTPGGAPRLRPDERVEDDVRRLTALLQDLHHAVPRYREGIQIVLLGFSDAPPEEQRGRRQAEAIADRLRSAGLEEMERGGVASLRIEDLGAHLMLGDPGAPERAPLNRRVEVWLVPGR